MSDSAQGRSPETLAGWKEIAGHLGRSVRSVQRYERELQLPVHRIRGPDGQSVYARRAEIDEWRRKVDDRHLDDDAENPRGGLLWSVAGIALLMGIAIGAGAVLWRARAVTPTELTLAGTTLTAADSGGRALWQHEFGTAVRSPDRNLPAFVEAGSELLVPVTFARAGEASAQTDALVGFSHSGKRLWTVAPDQSFTCGSETFSGPWQMSGLAVADDGPHPRVWVAFTHHTWWPSFVWEVDEHGRSSLRYVQTGWIRALTRWTTPSGTFLVAGGVMDEAGRASVAFVDEDGPAATAPAGDPRFACTGLPAGTPRRVLLLPPLELASLQRRAGDISVTELRVISADLKVTSAGGAAVSRVGADLALHDFSLADGYWASHRILEQQGRITHAAEDCLERTSPMEARRWTPDRGWETTMIRPTERMTMGGQ